MIKIPQNISIPHLNFIVKVRKFKKNPSVPHAKVYTHNVNNGESIIYLSPHSTSPQVAHEIMHVLQHICETKGMYIELEREHTAYLMQYLLGKITGWEYIPH